MMSDDVWADPDMVKLKYDLEQLKVKVNTPTPGGHNQPGSGRLGEKYICYITRTGKYRVLLSGKRKLKPKAFYTLEEAIEYRDQHLNDK
jgi:hypothetical protein